MDGKVVRDGKVAVAISPGFGAGWTTWNRGEISPFEPKVIAMIEAGKQSEIDEEWCRRELGVNGVYCGGAADLQIVWIKEGIPFYISEYDGSEAVHTQSDED